MRKEKQAWIDAVLAELPEKPRKDFNIWFDSQDISETSQELLMFRRESMQETPSMGMLMTPEEIIQEYSKPAHWGARCTCTACGEEFLAGYASESGQRGIVVYLGEDGMIYDGWCRLGAPETIFLCEGDSIGCPFCGATVILTREAALRSGRNYAAQAMELYRLADGSCALIYWIVRRHIDSYAISEWEVVPREAIVLGRDERLYFFTHARHGMYGDIPLECWQLKSTGTDPEQIRYYCWGAEGNKVIGAYHRKDNLETEGTTAEKTALDIYLRCGGHWPVVYLKLWKKHPNIENLMRQGWEVAVISEIEHQVECALMYGMKKETVEIEGIRWNEVKPHKMLGMSKVDFRQSKTWKWGRKELNLWLSWRDKLGNGTTAAMFNQWYKVYGADSVELLTEKVISQGWEDGLQKIIRYLDKQIDIEATERAKIFADYRKMLMAIEGDTNDTVQLWPGDLRAAHDRLAIVMSFESSKMLQKQFEKTAALYSPLEWTDGEFCIVVPKSNEDLVKEGRTLHHCVGGYGEEHVNGKPIFFVRHYRRPERSYYTLNENLSGNIPTRIQLHGYGNERHWKKNSLVQHHIPKKVLDFVERWEREVLLPWDIERKKAAINAASNSVKKTRGRRNAA